MKRLSLGRMPDPGRAHGAWVYLATSILAGVLTSLRSGPLEALLGGLGFAGLFLVAGGFAVGWPRGRRRLVGGALLAVLAPAAAMALGAGVTFLGFGVVAILPATLAGYFAERDGFLSPGALGFAVTALVVAAPSAACAGGTPIPIASMLLGALAPFFAYRTWVLRRQMIHRKGWSKKELKRRGWQEALYAIAWTLGVVFLLHVVS